MRVLFLSAVEFFCGGQEDDVERGVGHIGIEREHGTDDALVGQALEVLIHSAARLRHHPIGLDVVPAGHEIALFHHHDVHLARVDARAFERWRG